MESLIFLLHFLFYFSNCLVFAVFNLCRAGNCWWWVPLVAPLIGGVLGAGVYKAFVELHHPHPSEQNRVLGEDVHIPLVKRV